MGVVVYSSDSFALANARLDEASTSLGRLADSCEQISWYPPLAANVLASSVIYVASLEGGALAISLRQAAAKADLLGDQLVQAQQWYEGADRAVVDAIAGVSNIAFLAGADMLSSVAQFGAGALIGFLSSPGGQMLLAGVFLGGGALLASGVIDADEVTLRLQELGEGAVDRLGPLLSNPVTVMLLRGLVSASDDLVNSAIAESAGALGMGGAVVGGVIPGGVTLSVTVASLLGAAGLGTFRSPNDLARGPLTVLQGGRQPQHQVAARSRVAGPAPTSIRGIVDHIPRSRDRQPQVRITTYRDSNGDEVHLVSVAGTSTTEIGGANAFDNLSNLAAYAGDESESIAGVQQAMAQAGIQPGDRVVLSGYSQGALVVTRLAQSEQWDVQSMVIAGSPISGNEIPADIPVVQLEHTNDPITALQGIGDPPRNQVSLVTRNTHPEGVPLGASPLAGHRFDEYRITAGEFDSLSGVAEQAQRDRALAPLQDVEVVRSADYTITRQP